jgi:hypothetical protein
MCISAYLRDAFSCTEMRAQQKRNIGLVYKKWWNVEDIEEKTFLFFLGATIND